MASWRHDPQMRPFTLFKIWKNKAIHDFDIEHFENIDQAKEHAKLMIRRHGYDAIEILDGDSDGECVTKDSRDEWLNSRANSSPPATPT